MLKLITFCTVLFLFQKISFAQDTLPKITVAQISNKVLISWTNHFYTITTINIQRSFDSLKNFSTIGSVLDVKTKINGFIDAKPLNANMFYRVFLSFEGGTYLFTKSKKPDRENYVDIPGLKDFQQNSNTNSWFVPSKRIYTGRDNNVIISLPDAGKKKYAIKFFEENGAFIFELTKIAEPYLTLEKVNFIHAGIFDFELYENNVLIEKHKVYVPKDGKPGSGTELGKPLIK